MVFSLASIKFLRRRILYFFIGRHHYRFLIRHYLPPSDIQAARVALSSIRYSEQLVCQETPAPGGRILVIAPHPDDEILGPGGTLLSNPERFLKVVYLTSGRNAEISVREAEARIVCEQLGAEPVFLRFTDGDLPADDKIIYDLEQLIRSFEPTVVMLPFFLDDHPDHRQSNRIFVSACQRARVYPEVWAYQVYSAALTNVIVDITSQKDLKANLIRCYASQMVSRDWANFSLGLNAWCSRFLRSKDSAWGEAFFVVPFTEYRRLVENYIDKLT